LSKALFDFVKKESIYLAIVFLALLLILKIVFFKENFVVLTRYTFSLFWLFILPGYSAMLYWREKIEFVERIVVGFAVSAAVIGVFSYYIGLIGLNIKYHIFLLPLILIIAGIFFASKAKVTSS
jgi:uncharacterized membrane protein